MSATRRKSAEVAGQGKVCSGTPLNPGGWFVRMIATVANALTPWFPLIGRSGTAYTLPVGHLRKLVLAASPKSGGLRVE